MCSATEFKAEIAHANNSYLTAVLLTEERHCTELVCFFNRHNPAINFHSIGYGSVYNSFYLFELFCSHCLIMREVESESLIAYE